MRRPRAWPLLLWLLIALMPLRGLGQGLMLAGSLATADAAVTMAITTGAALGALDALGDRTLPPCHEGQLSQPSATLPAADLPAAAHAHAPTTAHPCAHCDLCHAVWVTEAPPMPAIGSGPAEPPGPPPALAEPSAPQRGIFRPPRG